MIVESESEVIENTEDLEHLRKIALYNLKARKFSAKINFVSLIVNFLVLILLYLRILVIG